MTAKHTAISLTLRNLSGIFGESNAQKRMQAIADLWVPSDEMFFVDAMWVLRSHGGINEMVEKIQSWGAEGDEFVELGRLEFLHRESLQRGRAD